MKNKQLLKLFLILFSILFGTILLAGAVGAAVILIILHCATLSYWLIIIIAAIGFLLIATAIKVIAHLIYNLF